MHGQCNYLQINTLPGCGNYFSPPRGWNGTGEDFINYFRQLTQHDMVFRSKLMALVHRMKISHLEPVIEGPFRDQVKLILDRTSQAVFKQSANPA